MSADQLAHQFGVDESGKKVSDERQNAARKAAHEAAGQSTYGDATAAVPPPAAETPRPPTAAVTAPAPTTKTAAQEYEEMDDDTFSRHLGTMDKLADPARKKAIVDESDRREAAKAALADASSSSDLPSQGGAAVDSPAYVEPTQRQVAEEVYLALQDAERRLNNETDPTRQAALRTEMKRLKDDYQVAYHAQEGVKQPATPVKPAAPATEVPAPGQAFGKAVSAPATASVPADGLPEGRLTPENIAASSDDALRQTLQQIDPGFLGGQMAGLPDEVIQKVRRNLSSSGREFFDNAMGIPRAPDSVPASGGPASAPTGTGKRPRELATMSDIDFDAYKAASVKSASPAHAKEILAEERKRNAAGSPPASGGVAGAAATPSPVVSPSATGKPPASGTGRQPATIRPVTPATKAGAAAAGGGRKFVVPSPPQGATKRYMAERASLLNDLGLGSANPADHNWAGVKAKIEHEMQTPEQDRARQAQQMQAQVDLYKAGTGEDYPGAQERINELLGAVRQSEPADATQPTASQASAPPAQGSTAPSEPIDDKSVAEDFTKLDGSQLFYRFNELEQGLRRARFGTPEWESLFYKLADARREVERRTGSGKASGLLVGDGSSNSQPAPTPGGNPQQTPQPTAPAEPQGANPQQTPQPTAPAEPQPAPTPGGNPQQAPQPVAPSRPPPRGVDGKKGLTGPDNKPRVRLKIPVAYPNGVRVYPPASRMGQRTVTDDTLRQAITDFDGGGAPEVQRGQRDAAVAELARRQKGVPQRVPTVPVRQVPPGPPTGPTRPGPQPPTATLPSASQRPPRPVPAPSGQTAPAGSPATAPKSPPVTQPAGRPSGSAQVPSRQPVSPVAVARMAADPATVQNVNSLLAKRGAVPPGVAASMLSELTAAVQAGGNSVSKQVGDRTYRLFYERDPATGRPRLMVGEEVYDLAKGEPTEDIPTGGGSSPQRRPAAADQTAGGGLMPWDEPVVPLVAAPPEPPAERTAQRRVPPAAPSPVPPGYSFIDDAAAISAGAGVPPAPVARNVKSDGPPDVMSPGNAARMRQALAKGGVTDEAAIGEIEAAVHDAARAALFETGEDAGKPKYFRAGGRLFQLTAFDGPDGRQTYAVRMVRPPQAQESPNSDPSVESGPVAPVPARVRTVENRPGPLPGVRAVPQPPQTPATGAESGAVGDLFRSLNLNTPDEAAKASKLIESTAAGLRPGQSARASLGGQPVIVGKGSNGDTYLQTADGQKVTYNPAESTAAAFIRPPSDNANARGGFRVRGPVTGQSGGFTESGGTPGVPSPRRAEVVPPPQPPAPVAGPALPAGSLTPEEQAEFEKVLDGIRFEEPDGGAASPPVVRPSGAIPERGGPMPSPVYEIEPELRRLNINTPREISAANRLIEKTVRDFVSSGRTGQTILIGDEPVNVLSGPQGVTVEFPNGASVPFDGSGRSPRVSAPATGRIRIGGMPEKSSGRGIPPATRISSPPRGPQPVMLPKDKPRPVTQPRRAEVVPPPQPPAPVAEPSTPVLPTVTPPSTASVPTPLSPSTAATPLADKPALPPVPTKKPASVDDRTWAAFQAALQQITDPSKMDPRLRAIPRGPARDAAIEKRMKVLRGKYPTVFGAPARLTAVSPQGTSPGGGVALPPPPNSQPASTSPAPPPRPPASAQPGPATANDGYVSDFLLRSTGVRTSDLPNMDAETRRQKVSEAAAAAANSPPGRLAKVAEYNGMTVPELMESLVRLQAAPEGPAEKAVDETARARSLNARIKKLDAQMRGNITDARRDELQDEVDELVAELNGGATADADAGGDAAIDGEVAVERAATALGIDPDKISDDVRERLAESLVAETTEEGAVAAATKALQGSGGPAGTPPPVRTPKGAKATAASGQRPSGKKGKGRVTIKADKPIPVPGAVGTKTRGKGKRQAADKLFYPKDQLKNADGSALLSMPSVIVIRRPLRFTVRSKLLGV